MRYEFNTKNRTTGMRSAGRQIAGLSRRSAAEADPQIVPFTPTASTGGRLGYNSCKDFNSFSVFFILATLPSSPRHPTRVTQEGVSANCAIPWGRRQLVARQRTRLTPNGSTAFFQNSPARKIGARSLTCRKNFPTVVTPEPGNQY